MWSVWWHVSYLFRISQSNKAREFNKFLSSYLQNGLAYCVQLGLIKNRLMIVWSFVPFFALIIWIFNNLGNDWFLKLKILINQFFANYGCRKDSFQRTTIAFCSIFNAPLFVFVFAMSVSLVFCQKNIWFECIEVGIFFWKIYFFLLFSFVCIYQFGST